MSILDGLFGPPNVEKLKAKGDVNGLIKASHYEKDYFVRMNAVDALGEIKDSSAIEPLIAALNYRTLAADDAKRALIELGWKPSNE